METSKKTAYIYQMFVSVLEPYGFGRYETTDIKEGFIYIKKRRFYCKN
jgi:hypothetical protein